MPQIYTSHNVMRNTTMKKVRSKILSKSNGVSRKDIFASFKHSIYPGPWGILKMDSERIEHTVVLEYSNIKE